MSPLLVFHILMAIEAATLVVWTGGYLCTVFFSTSLAAGLYYLAELIEEHTQLAHSIIAFISEGTMVIHLVLLFWDKMPWLPVLVSASAHAVYLQLLKTFPFFRFKSWEAIASIAAAAGATGMWIRHFSNSWHTLEYIFGFMLMTTWLTPMLLVLSLAANDNTLPGAEAGRPSATSGTAGKPRKRKNRSLLLTAFSYLQEKLRDSFPGQSEGPPHSTRRPSLKPHTV